MFLPVIWHVVRATLFRDHTTKKKQWSTGPQSTLRLDDNPTLYFFRVLLPSFEKKLTQLQEKWKHI